MGSLFGNGDVRGLANTELTPDLAFKLGKATGYVLGKAKDKPVFLIGKDTRLSGDMLEDALSAGFMSTGANVIKVGVLPTPAIAYLVKAYGADAGVIVSASHNSFEYNGIKFYNSEGFKMDDAFEDEVETILLRNIHMDSHVSGEGIGKCLEVDDEAEDRYAKYLEGTIDADIKGLKLVVDCANGSAYKVAEKVFTDLGADVVMIGNEPDGLNINAHCGSTHPELIQKQVVENGAFMGFAYDGDADRLIACDEKGNIIDGDKDKAMLKKMFPQEGANVPEIRFKGFTDTWEQRKLGESLSFLKDGTHGTHTDAVDGPLLLSAKNIKNGTIKWDDTDRRISIDEYKKIHSKFSLQDGDVLLTIVGSIGETAILRAPEGLTFQRSVAFLRPSDDITSEFLYTEIQTTSFQKELENRKSTSAQPGIYLGDLAEIPFSFPAQKDEQERIGTFFANLDNTITLHQRKHEKLINIKKAMLEKMFI